MARFTNQDKLELLDYLGIPSENVLRATINIEPDELITVDVSYMAKVGSTLYEDKMYIIHQVNKEDNPEYFL